MFNCSWKPDVMFMKSGHDVCILELHFYRKLITSTLLPCYYNRKKESALTKLRIYLPCCAHHAVTLS